MKDKKMDKMDGKKWMEKRNAQVEPSKNYYSEGDMRTMIAAEEIKSDPKRMKACKDCMKKEMEKLKKVMPKE